jgi:hypothetical protein
LRVTSFIIRVSSERPRPDISSNSISIFPGTVESN